MCLRLLSVVSVLLVLFGCLSISAYAELITDSAAHVELSEESSSVEDIESEPLSEVTVIDVPEYDTENPLPVVVVDDEPAFESVSPFAVDAPVVVIGNTPPDSPLFYGSGWVTGIDSTLGIVTIYYPINYKDGYFGLDANGYLYNVSSTSITGYLEDVYNNSVSTPGFSYPRYRSGSGYDYFNIYLTPTDSNMNIATGNTPRLEVSDLTPYLILLVGGVLILCYMRRS